MPDVLAALAAGCPPVAPRTLPLADAAGGVLAEPLLLPTPVPARAVALRAGYAVASRDLVGVSAYAPLPLHKPPIRVEAGDPLPDGCDAVLPPDGLSRAGPLAEIVAAVGPGENARRRGEGGAAGDVLVPAGTVLRAMGAAAATAAGLSEASVRQAWLRIVAPPGLGWIAPVLSRLDGARVERIDGLPVNDWGGPDLTLVVADAVPDIAGTGARTVAGGLALRPGEGAQVLLSGARPLVLVPPRLETLLAVSCCLLRPLLAHLTGRGPQPIWRRAPLARKLASSIGVTEVALVRETMGGLEPLALGSLSLPAMAAAEGWISVPPESEGFQAGDRVDAYEL